MTPQERQQLQAQGMSSEEMNEMGRFGVRRAIAGLNMKSALDFIIDNEWLELLELPQVREIQRQKWNRFAEEVFNSRFYWHMATLAVFLMVVVLQAFISEDDQLLWVVRDYRRAYCTAGWRDESDGRCPWQPMPDGFWWTALVSAEASWEGMLVISGVVLEHFWSWEFMLGTLAAGGVLTGELYILLAAVRKLYIELKEISRRGFNNYWHTRGAGGLENWTALAFSVGIVAMLALSVFGSFYQDGLPAWAQNLYSVIYAGASLGAWGMMIFFLLGFEDTGPYVVAIYRMLGKDVFRFGKLMIVLLLGYTQAGFVLAGADGSERQWRPRVFLQVRLPFVPRCAAGLRVRPR